VKVRQLATYGASQEDAYYDQAAIHPKQLFCFTVALGPLVILG
jgi:hypothetical protein